MANLTEIIVTVVVGLLTADIVAHAPNVTRWLVRRAANVLPKVEQDRFREEWLAHAEELPGSIAKLLHGLSCYLKAARSISRSRNPAHAARKLRITCALARAYMWSHMVRVIVPTYWGLFIRDDAGGRPKHHIDNLRILLKANQLLIETYIIEHYYRKRNDAEVNKAINDTGSKIVAILKDATKGDAP